MTTKIKLLALFVMVAIGTSAGVQALSSNAEDNQSALAILSDQTDDLFCFHDYCN